LPIDRTVGEWLEALDGDGGGREYCRTLAGSDEVPVAEALAVLIIAWQRRASFDLSRYSWQQQDHGQFVVLAELEEPAVATAAVRLAVTFPSAATSGYQQWLRLSRRITEGLKDLDRLGQAYALDEVGFGLVHAAQRRGIPTARHPAQMIQIGQCIHKRWIRRGALGSTNAPAPQIADHDLAPARVLEAASIPVPNTLVAFSHVDVAEAARVARLLLRIARTDGRGAAHVVQSDQDLKRLAATVEGNDASDMTTEVPATSLRLLAIGDETIAALTEPAV
jgi:hypothetical protein